jgi:hypothetical protein
MPEEGENSLFEIAIFILIAYSWHFPTRLLIDQSSANRLLMLNKLCF